MISRLYNYGRFLERLLTRNSNNLNLKQNRKSSHAANYRVATTKHSKATHLGAELIGAAMWWWILWHLWHEHEHITGEFYYPDPANWSNRELGVLDKKN